MISMATRKKMAQGINLAVALLVLGIVLFPLIWMFFCSFKPNPELYIRPIRILPRTWTFEHYIELFWYSSFPRYFLNTFGVAVTACLIGVITSLCGVYSISRYRFIGTRTFAFIMLFVYMLPPVLLALPLFQIWFGVGLIDNLLSLAVTYLTLTMPFSLWILRPYIESIPRDLEHAAMVDGCTRFQAFYKVIIPQAWPGLITAFVFTFVVVWNEYLYASVLIRSEPLRTVSLGIASLILEMSIYSWGLVNASGVMVTLPILIVFILLQRKVISGLTAGAMKG